MQINLKRPANKRLLLVDLEEDIEKAIPVAVGLIPEVLMMIHFRFF